MFYDSSRAGMTVCTPPSPWKHQSPGGFFFAGPRSPNTIYRRALFVPRSNTAKQGASTALLDLASTHLLGAPLTHDSHQWPTPADLSRFTVSLVLTNSRLRRFCKCISDVPGISLLSVSLLSANVVAVVVRPNVTAQRVFICRSQTRAYAFP